MPERMSSERKRNRVISFIKKHQNSIEDMNLDNCDVEFLYYTIKRRKLAPIDILTNFQFRSVLEFQNQLMEYCSKKQNTIEWFVCRYGEKKGYLYYEEKRKSSAMTLKTQQEKYGIEEGSRRFAEYCEKQRITNTFEYKKDTYNWSYAQFEKFNRSRAVTLENLVKKYGQNEGELRFNSYREKQRFNNSIEKWGDEGFKDLNKRKTNTLENFLARHGKDEGESKFLDYLKKISKNKTYSKISQDLFSSLMYRFPFYNQKCYFAINHGEWFIYDKDHSRVFFYDFVCLPLKICLEFQGDYFHANPDRYDPSTEFRFFQNPVMTANEIWEKDRVKNDVFYKNMGFPVIEIWESDFRNNRKRVISEIMGYAKNNIY